MAVDTQSIYDRLSDTDTFHPGKVSGVFSDWTLQAGDVINVKSQGETFKMPVYGYSLSWNGSSQLSIEATGNEKRDDIAKKSRSSRSSYSRKQETNDVISSVKTALTGALDDLKTKLVLADITQKLVLEKINQDGLAELDVAKLTSGQMTTDYLKVNDEIALDGGAITAQQGTYNDLYVQHGDSFFELGAHTHSVTVADDGTVTLGDISTTGGSFNMADTKAYETLVSALLTGLRVGDPTYNSSTKRVSASVTTTFNSGRTASGTVSINASSAWQAGRDYVSVSDIEQVAAYTYDSDTYQMSLPLKATLNTGDDSYNKTINVGCYNIWKNGYDKGVEQGGTCTKYTPSKLVLNPLSSSGGTEITVTGNYYDIAYTPCGTQITFVTLAPGQSKTYSNPSTSGQTWYIYQTSGNTTPKVYKAGNPVRYRYTPSKHGDQV